MFVVMVVVYMGYSLCSKLLSKKTIMSYNQIKLLMIAFLPYSKN